MMMGEAMRSPWRYAKIDDASGCVSTDFLGTYPPGSPVVIPGDVIDDDVIGYFLSHNRSFFGFVGDKVKVVRQ
jgi:arginine/lysine/ornithine decarboxylase